MTSESFMPMLRDVLVHVEPELDTSELALDTRLAAVGVSSIVLMETVGVLEQRLKLRFSDEDLAQVATPRDLHRVITTRLPSA